MPKLPEFIFDSHKRYKADTNQLTAWLVETAEGLGYGSESLHSTECKVTAPTRLKGKARKQNTREATIASSTVEYKTIFVKEFTKLARFIAGSSYPIKVPRLVLKLAHSAISARKRCAEWFRHTATQEAVSDKTHWHFITVLEEVVRILDPLCDQDDTKSAAIETRPGEVALANSFSLLNVEETKDDDFCQTLPPVATQASTGTPLSQQLVVYTVAEDDTDDWFVVFCFFRDLSEIRNFLRETWSDYRDGKTDLITASVTTNMAFSIIRSAQEDLVSLHPNMDSYEGIADVLCSGTYIHLGEGPPPFERGGNLNLNLLDFEEFVYLQIFWMLLKFCDVIQPDILPVYLPGRFGIYDPHRSRDSLSIQEKRSEDRIILFETLPDFVSLARLRKNGQQTILHDELVKELQKMVYKKEISLLLVFAIQVYLDIHHVLREQVGQGLQDLRRAGVWVTRSLREYSQNSPKDKFENWGASNEACVENLKVFVKDWILSDFLGAIRNPVHLRMLPGVEVESYYLLTRHPFLCGMLQFRMQLTFQELGLVLATAWGTILFVSHLYEAGKNEGLLRLESWKDMEWVMKVHDKERMFRGRVPQNVSESFKSLSLMAGVSTSYFASTTRPTKKSYSRPKASPKGPSFLKENSAISTMFRDHIVHGALALTAETMGDLLADTGVDPSSLQLSKPQTKLQQQWAHNHKLTPLQFLAILRAALVAEQHIIRFDYVSLHMRCIQLLREIRVMLHDKFVQYQGEHYMENETQLSWLVGWILLTAAESEKATKMMRLRDGSLSNVMLVRASQVLDSFIEREGNAECTKLEKVLQQSKRS
jgi:hypothetical protein